jgi:hypothetical protein
MYLCIHWCLDVKSERNKHVINQTPITVAARSKAWTVFARSNTGIVGSNLTSGMDVYVRLFCVCVVLCIGRGLTTGCSPVQGVLLTVYRIKKLKRCQGPAKAYRGIERKITRYFLAARTSVFPYNTLCTIKNEGGNIYYNGVHVSELLDSSTCPSSDIPRTSVTGHMRL